MTSRAPRQSADDWFRIIAEFNQSSLNVEDFCSRRGYALSTFNRWKLRFSKQRPLDTSARATPSAFIEALPSESGSVIISLDESVRLECPLSLGIEQIAQLAKAVARDERI